jgi:AcrR family transcriptional regulator
MNRSRSSGKRKRAYRQGARAEAAQAAADRIVAVFAERLRDGWFDQIRLEDIAADAGVSVQTVIRRFGGKEGLIDAVHERMGQEIMARRIAPKGDIAAGVRVVIEDYEKAGATVMRALAQEDRFPAIRQVTDVGRKAHRNWLAELFSDSLAPLPAARARALLDALVVATDLYVWKLMRVDMRRPVAELQTLMEAMIHDALRRAQSEP